ncbi:MAG TPA: biliverdin-producing heme oxygenase [Caulobacteraceae bacterium]|nr:biliverdin-producing heme oxygenase [Caulobacteraceae bacterium]
MVAPHPDTTVRYHLRESTKDSHEHVDRAFARFDLNDPGGYAAFLRAHARVVPALENAVNGQALWSGWTPRAPALLEDLRALGAAPPASWPEVRALGPAAAWGLQYVLEGSKLGGAVLARRVGARLPRRYLTADTGGWRPFQAELERAGGAGDPVWRDQATRAAKEAFSLFRAAADQESGRPESDCLSDH